LQTKQSQRSVLIVVYELRGSPSAGRTTSPLQQINIYFKSQVLTLLLLFAKFQKEMLAIT
jgi:hypothetical protein